MGRRAVAVLALLGIGGYVGAQTAPDTQAVAASYGETGGALSILPEDILISQSIEGGYDLWIRRKDGMGSVLLTESSADPLKRADSYAFRDNTVREITRDERRILDGKLLVEQGARSIVDSTAEMHSTLGPAFHVFIPTVVVFGYPWSRYGEIQVTDGTFINIRTFAKPQADYTGAYHDNPFSLVITQKERYVPLPEPPPAAAQPKGVVYMPDAVEALTRIAREGGGNAALSTGEDDLGDKIGDLLDHTTGRSLDLVLALDTTNSMRDDMLYLRKRIVEVLREHIRRFEHYRVGILYYRDYNDDYLVQANPFVSDMGEVQRQIDTVQVGGGRDIPEAVYEALYHSIHRYQWEADARVILLVGDAPPHPIPRGRITREMVDRDAELEGIRISTIILPP